MRRVRHQLYPSRLRFRPLPQLRRIDEPERVVGRRLLGLLCKHGCDVTAFFIGDRRRSCGVSLDATAHLVDQAPCFGRVAQQLESGDSAWLARVRKQPIRGREQLLVFQQPQTRQASVAQIARLPLEQLDESIELVRQDGQVTQRFEYRRAHIGGRIAHEVEQDGALGGRE